jgi:hypothetical protein
LSRYAGSLPAYAAWINPAGGPPYYSFLSSGASVMVIVLDTPTLEATQEAWLQARLEEAADDDHVPAVVVGNEQPSPALSAILLNERASASAYFFDDSGANVKTSVTYGSRPPIPAYGTGTLGYVQPPNERYEADSLGSSGFLLASVDTAARSASTNIAPVSAHVIPNIGQLALDATDGVLLRRSQVALFEALARRPPGGVSIKNGNNGNELAGPDPYDHIPFDCQGPNCAFEVPIEYTFSSSNPEVGNFVAHDPSSSDPRQVLLNSKSEPVLDVPRRGPDGELIEEDGHLVNEKGEAIPLDQSGLFCAFNPGTTTISITTGGLTYSEPVTVQGGSVEYPCGTVPLKNPPPLVQPTKVGVSVPPPAPASSPPTNPLVQSIAPPPPPSPVAVHPKPPPSPPVLLPAVFPLVQPLNGPQPAIVPPPPTPTGQPTPPSGTSQVFSNVPEEKREEESALELTSSKSAVMYDANQSGGPGPWILILVVIAAGAGAGIGRRGRSGARARPALALASERRRRFRR